MIKQFRNNVMSSDDFKKMKTAKRVKKGKGKKKKSNKNEKMS